MHPDSENIPVAWSAWNEARGLCFAWYEAFGLLPNISNNATIPDIYRAFRAMPAQGSGFGARVVGSLGIALVIAGILVR